MSVAVNQATIKELYFGIIPSVGIYHLHYLSIRAMLGTKWFDLRTDYRFCAVGKYISVFKL